MWQKKFAVAVALFGTSLFAEEHSYTYWDIHPIHAGASSIFLGNANVTENPYGGQLLYYKANGFLSVMAPIDEKNFFIPRIEWNTFRMSWDKNPKFKTKQFYFMQFGLTFYSNAIDRWRWVVRADYNMDTDHFGNSRYGLFSALLWGAYEIWDQWHYHVGSYGYTGMSGAQVYPLIGVDYAPTESWLIYLVFPLDYKVVYKIDSRWSIALKGRPLKERFRTDQYQPQPRSVFNYSTMGAELNVVYEKFLRLEVEAYLGWNFGGSFYIKDRTGHNALYTDVGSSPYGGLNINYGF